MGLHGCGTASSDGTALPKANRTAVDSAAVDSAAVETADGEGVSVDQVLQRLVSTYRSARSYYDNAQYHERFVQRTEGIPREPLPHQVSVVFSRPNRLRLTRRVPDTNGDDLEIVAVSDGATLQALSSEQAQPVYSESAPQQMSYDELLGAKELANLLFPVPLEFLFPQLDLLLASDNEPRLLAKAQSRLLTSESLAGADCHRVEIQHPNGTYVAWIDQESSVLRRLEIPTGEVRAQLDPDGDLIRLELWIDFHDATLNTNIGPQTFALPSGDAEAGSSTKLTN